ncbi:MAG: hypothetical protein ABJO01_14375 [Parasphingorhabdus sp.]
MERHGDEILVTEKEASNKTRPQGVRWVLAFSMIAALVAMSLAWIIPALS